MHQVQKLVRKICQAIGTPAAKGVETLSQSGEWAQLQKLKLGPPHTYASAWAYRDDNFVTEFVRKLAIPGNSAIQIAAAKETFYTAEAQCLRTNGFLAHLENGLLTQNDLAVRDFIHHWRRIVKDVLGPLPKRLYPRYSPGSTLSDVGIMITIPDKMSSYPTCYPHSLSVTEHSKERTELASCHRPKFRRGNRFFVVPKEALKGRGCCVEAKDNVVCQLDAGAHIRSRYNRYYKVRLEHMQDYHRLAAKLASMGLPYVTIDLSNASDTIARALVRALLPTEWYELLESLRARFTYIDGRYVYLEKFSSMGNGFTFELETLLFRTLASALGAGDDDCLVYGDDIIVSQSLSKSMLLALERFGFTPNARKTFCEGPFRESCGGDFFHGIDVRAVYLKEIPDEPQKWIVLHNQLSRWDHEGRLHAARRFCVDQVPTSWRLFGPDDGNDFWFYCADPQPLSSGQTSKKWERQGIQPGTLGFWGMTPVSTKILVSSKWFRDSVVIACALMGTGEQVALRGKISGYRRTFIPLHGLCERETKVRFPGLIS